ncbi:MAG: FIST C-terminal domain-containing protein [Clostridiales Family XIII bacterium]|jgi:hypothetical protein|nr:FIST C-terminal domain-containing protein [Clostridiales Family XIII bacterium]
MIKMLTARTDKFYDPEIAVQEILSQIDIAHDLRANSAGVIACYHEFVEYGVTEAIAGALPFDVIGCTVMGNATSDASGPELLSLTVLTSDELEFAAALSGPISDGGEEAPIRGAYDRARGNLGGDPALIFCLAPIMTDVSGDLMVRLLDNYSGGNIPIFGTLSNDTALTYENARVFLNGESHRDKMALLLVRGNIAPAFFVMSISEKNIYQQSALITGVEGYRLREVNGLPLTSYLESIGIDASGMTAASTLPLLVDFGDGAAPIACSMYAISSEGALLGFEVPNGATITFAEIDYTSVMDTCAAVMDSAVRYIDENPGRSGVIAVSCLSRFLVLSPESSAEMERARGIVGGRAPFCLMYSGGEICPVNTADGRLINRFHNLTYTLMII